MFVSMNVLNSYALQPLKACAQRSAGNYHQSYFKNIGVIQF